ncbi:septal ring lytic transglycosylase RlpA family protein [Ferrovibrio sp.]|uniref:septal ring lytic transglycosylase RlpA family protein n=1 Tax=Ferrovibrio sp. TaxID=1917215 RepID=UPI003D2A29CB
MQPKHHAIAGFHPGATALVKGPAKGLWLTMFLVLAGLGLTGCAETQLVAHATKSVVRPDPTPPVSAPAGRGTGIYKVGNPYQINGVWYYPKEDPNYDETGIGSWYGEQFHGRATANGEIFDMNEVTAAHTTLPMPSLVRVTNLENGRSIVVRVNDRGPYVNSRVIDLSRRSAQLLGYDRQGTAKVRVQYIGPAPLADGSVAVASAAAQRSGNEERPAASPRGAVVSEALAPPPSPRGNNAARNSSSPNVVDAATSSQPSSVQIMATANQGQAGTPAASNTPRANPSAELARQPVQTVSVPGAKNIYVQVGAFTQHENASRAAAALSNYGRVGISSRVVNNQEFFRVRLGPFDQVSSADTALQQMLSIGQTNARIVVE